MHLPAKGSVGARQISRDGTRLDTEREYAVKLLNVTCFMDISRLTAYFQKLIAAEFDLEYMDTCTTSSQTSSVWRLTVKMAGFPGFLRGMVRLN